MIYAADFTNGRGLLSPTLTFYMIDSGRRTFVSQALVADKREARTLAAKRGAKCWNF